jgi:hypothetical protein
VEVKKARRETASERHLAGLAGLYRPGADLMLAEAAKLANIPFIQSGASTASIEAVAKVAPDQRQIRVARGKGRFSGVIGSVKSPRPCPPIALTSKTSFPKISRGS